MRQIVRILPKDRQTMLFSATQTTKVWGAAAVVRGTVPWSTGSSAPVSAAGAGEQRVVRHAVCWLLSSMLEHATYQPLA